MPPRSKVLALPAEVKFWLDAALLENNFSGYDALAAELKARGYELGKSSLHRYGQEFEDRVKTLKVATEQARAIAEELPDDEGALNDAILRLTQQHLFKVLMEMQVDPKKVNLGSLTKSIADLAKASVTQKQHQLAVRDKVKATAEDVVKVARSNGLSDEAADEIRRKILGISE